MIEMYIYFDFFDSIIHGFTKYLFYSKLNMHTYILRLN